VKIWQLVEWLATRPAKQIGLEGKKGSLQIGADADFICFDTEAKFVVSDTLVSSTK